MRHGNRILANAFQRGRRRTLRREASRTHTKQCGLGGWPKPHFILQKNFLATDYADQGLGDVSKKLIFAFVSPILPRMKASNSTAKIISVNSSFSEAAAANSQVCRESIALAVL